MNIDYGGTVYLEGATFRDVENTALLELGAAMMIYGNVTLNGARFSSNKGVAVLALTIVDGVGNLDEFAVEDSSITSTIDEGKLYVSAEGYVLGTFNSENNTGADYFAALHLQITIAIATHLLRSLRPQICLL